jgi:hypothetical protein
MMLLAMIAALISSLRDTPRPVRNRPDNTDCRRRAVSQIAVHTAVALDGGAVDLTGAV